MRLRTLLKLLAIGLAAVTVTRYLRGRRRVDPFRAPDPADPVQRFGDASDLELDDLAVDALSREDVEAAQDLAVLEIELDRIVGDDELAVERVDIDDVIAVRDGGDLYGAHTPPAVGRAHPDDDQAFVEGQNWVEALETSAIENGAAPERELTEIADDEDLLRPPHPSLGRDTPVADFGSGGRRGL